MNTDPTPARTTTVDVTGKACPVPVLTLSQTMDQCAVGDVIEVHADDPGAKVDIPVWCRMQNQELVSITEEGNRLRFTVRKLV